MGRDAVMRQMKLSRCDAADETAREMGDAAQAHASRQMCATHDACEMGESYLESSCLSTSKFQFLEVVLGPRDSRGHTLCLR